MRVKLVRKFAECIDDVDLSAYTLGDILHMPPRSASLLIAEGWAVRLDHQIGDEQDFFQSESSEEDTQAVA